MTDATPPSDPIDELRAALGAQYSVERLLGQGGMGSVYLARDVTLDRPVAVKVINPDIAANPTLRARFLQEARTVARLRHPNIVPVYAAGESNGLLYFVMEFVPGEGLRDVMTRSGPVESERGERILREVALALGHAHSLGLVHRDVKPENILIDQASGSAMLTDFGVARAFERDGGLTQAGFILGSPKYMSPEQASGDRAIDGRSDLYSLALVGYELFTGHPVVQSATVAGMLVKHITETPPPLAEKASDISLHVAHAIDRGLAKNPDERWQTGREFAEALAGHALTPTGEERGGAPRKRPGPARRAIGAAIAALILAVAWLAFGRRESAVRTFLVAPFEIQSGDPSVAWLREGSVNMLALTFGQWSDLNVVDYERTLSLLDAEGLGDKPRLSLDDAMALARRAQAATVVTGQVQTTRDSLIVNAKLYDVRSGKSTMQAQEGSSLSADPRPLFDRLAQQLLDIWGGRTSTMQLAQATTTSLEAYRAYLEGSKHLNAWRLPEADAEFARATALDSTFALAFYKRALGLGWSQAGGADYANAAERAFALSRRLPQRERSLVEGHYHLVRAQVANITQDTTGARLEYAASIKSYQDLIGRGDSLSAEAWYGLADAYFHARFGVGTISNDTLRDYTTRSLRGFHKTLAIDSTYHLAYSHLVQLYNAAASNSNLLISGDSTIMVAEETDVTRLGGLEALRKLRAAAASRGIEIAKAWMRADAESPQPILQVAQSYLSAQFRDSALEVLIAASGRPATASPSIRLALLQAQVGAGDSGAAATLRYILDRYTVDSLRRIPTGQRFGEGGAMLTAAAMLGRGADVDKATALFAAANPMMPFSETPTGSMVALYRRAMHLAMGDSMTPDTRRALLGELRAMDAESSPLGQQVRIGSLSVPYLGFLMTRDTAFLTLVKKWSGSPSNAQPLPELDALAALSRGDTATARRLADVFPSPDSLRNPRTRFGYGGMRSVARAEVLAAVGRPRQAAESFEATSVERFNQNGLAEPGYAVWVRTWLARARLWRELGERERAIKAYEEFIRRWKDADGSAAEEVAQARRELAQLKDAPR